MGGFELLASPGFNGGRIVPAGDFGGNLPDAQPRARLMESQNRGLNRRGGAGFGQKAEGIFMAVC